MIQTLLRCRFALYLLVKNDYREATSGSKVFFFSEKLCLVHKCYKYEKVKKCINFKVTFFREKVKEHFNKNFLENILTIFNFGLR